MKIFIIPVTNWKGDSGFDGTTTRNEFRLHENSAKNWKSFLSIFVVSLISLDNRVMQFLTRESDSEIKLFVKAI